MKILFVSEDVEVGDRGMRELERLGHEVSLLRSHADAVSFFEEHKEHFEIIITHQDDDIEKGIQVLLNCRVKKPRVISGMLCIDIDEQERKKLEGCRIAYFEKPYLYRRVITELRTKKPPPVVTEWDVKKKGEAAGESPINATAPEPETKKKRSLTSLFFGKKKD